MKRLNFYQKISLGYLVAFSSFLVIAGLSLWAIKSIVHDKDHIISQKAMSIRLVQKLLFELESKVTAVRGFLLTGYSMPHLVRLQMARDNFIDAIDELSSGAVDVTDKEFIAKISDLERMHEAEIKYIVGLKKRKANTVLELEFEKNLVPLKTQLTSILNEYLNIKERSFQIHVNQSANLVTWLQRLVSAAYSVILLMMTSFGFMFRRIFNDRKHAEEERTVLLERESTARQHAEMLTTRLRRAQEDERLRISREIHDELGQMLTAIKFELVALKKRFVDSPPIVDSMSGLVQTVDTSIKSARRIAADLRPTVLEDFGLEAALEWWCKQYEEKVNVKLNLSFLLKVPSNKTLSGETSTTVFRVTQEAVTNAVRHSQTKVIDIKIGNSRSMINVTIQDYGIGMEVLKTGPYASSLGIAGMHERVHSCGGTLEITTELGKGTCVTAYLPFGGDNNDKRTHSRRSLDHSPRN